MDVREGDRVVVNLAPFIGSRVRSERSIACRVTAADGEAIEVVTEPPYRTVTLRILPSWVERVEVEREDLFAAAM